MMSKEQIRARLVELNDQYKSKQITNDEFLKQVYATKMNDPEYRRMYEKLSGK